MLWAQFYQRGTTDKIIEGCGDRSVIVIDGRLSPENAHSIALVEMQRRGYVGYQLMRGATFTRSAPASNYVGEH